MLLHRAAAALITWHEDLHVIFNQDSHRREIDLAKDRFHQTASQQRDSGAGRTMLQHQLLSVARGGLSRGRLSGEQEAMRQDTPAA